MHRRVSRGGGGGLEIETQKKVIRAHFKLFHLHYATFFVENIIFSAFHKDLYINRHPWMTEALRTQIRLKNSKYKEYVKSNNVDIVESYKDSKRILHSSLRNAEISVL